jgi:hypothetical protein
VAGRPALALSCWRRGYWRGGAGRAGSTGPREQFGRGGARRATVEHDRRRGGAAAVAAHRYSQQRAGEPGDLARARAPGGDGDAVSILRLAKEVAVGCCRR